MTLSATLLQTDIAWEDPAANFERVRSLLAKSPPQPGGLVVLPEMYPTGFSFNHEAVAAAASPARDFLAALARETECLTLGGVAALENEAPPAGSASPWGRNEFFAFDPAGSELVRYQKVRTFAYTEEAQHFHRGSRVEVFSWNDWKICPLVCYDLRFPELFRAGLAKGAELFVVVANWPRAREDHWVTLLRARAIENQAFVIGVNRAGSDPTWDYPGRSLLVDPHGAVLADAGDGEKALTCQLDREILLAWRAEFPAWSDRVDPGDLAP